MRVFCIPECKLRHARRGYTDVVGLEADHTGALGRHPRISRIGGTNLLGSYTFSGGA
jgi:hypothetical protein